MELPDGTTLFHGPRPYDPAKAHAYYMKTRKLKGRKKGQTQDVGRTSALGSMAVGLARGAGQKNRSNVQARADAAARVAGLEKKLSLLNRELKKRMAEARKSEREAKKPDSASEKADAARESKKYRDKNQQQLKTKAKQARAKQKPAKKSGGGDSIEGLQKTIEGVQQRLAAAKAKQRALSSG